MNEKEIQQALQYIAVDEVGNEIDLWPEIEGRMRRPYRANLWQWGMRLAGTAVAVFVLVMFLSWLASLSRGVVMDDGPEAAVETPMIATSFTVAPELVFPDAPATLARFEVTIVPSPQTSEEMLAWARAFGQPDPKIYRDPRSPEMLLSVGSDGTRLTFHNEYNWINYLSSDWPEEAVGETIDVEAGTAVAQAFLEQHNQLPPDFHILHHISAYFNAGGYPGRIMQFTYDLNGYPVSQGVNLALGATVHVDSSGEIISAGFARADFSQFDRVVVRPAEEVINDFINGRPVQFAREVMPAYAGQRIVNVYYPPLPQHQIGEEVTVLETDDTHFLVAEDGSEVRATLATGVGGKYELVTPDLAHIAETIEYDELMVTGTIAAQLAPDTWRLEVASWEIVPQQAISSGCAIGPVTIEESGTWIVAESVIGEVVENGRYQINNLPPEIQNGDRIEVCAEPIPGEREPLSWSVLYVPPRDFSQKAIISDTYVIEEVQLVYFHDLEDPGLTLAQPAWMVSGRAPGSASRFVAYLDAVQR